MRKKPSEEENRLFEEITSGQAGNLLLMAIELNGKDCSCVFAFEEVDEKTMLSPLVILVNDDIAKDIKLPDGFDELTLPNLDLDDDEDDPLDGLPPMNMN